MLVVSCSAPSRSSARWEVIEVTRFYTIWGAPRSRRFLPRDCSRSRELFALRTPSLRLSVVRFVVFAASPGIRTAALSSKRNAPSHSPMPTQDELKKQVGFKAVDDYVQSGMVIGLGTGR